jgi:predicted nuclease of predicted toxin-antitoxin system
MSTPRFYTDVHIAIEAVRQLRHKGVAIIHCGDVGMSDADDESHLEYASTNRLVMVTCDADFERYHAQWQTVPREHAGIVYFKMSEGCKDIGTIVREILFLHEAANYETDLYNQIWRA